jgi:uncharacterized membrane protein
MNKIIGIILVVVGAYLLYRGYNVSESVGGQLLDVSNRITGRADGKAMQFYLGGAICCAVGLVIMFFRSSKK